MVGGRFLGPLLTPELLLHCLSGLYAQWESAYPADMIYVCFRRLRKIRN